MPAFQWSMKSELAVALLVQGELTHAQIGQQIGVNRKTLFEWRQHPDFAARVDDELARYREEVRRVGIAQLERRVQALNDRWLGLLQIIRERADDPSMSAVPGGTTGLLIRTVKGVGRGDDFRIVELFEIDAALLRELREHERQAGQELGWWTTKVDAGRTEAGAEPCDPEAGRVALAAASRVHRESGPDDKGGREEAA